MLNITLQGGNMKQISTLILSTCLSLSALAADVPQSFSEQLNLTPQMQTQQTESTQTCADFTGTWKGTCAVDNKTHDDSFTATQKGCEFLEVTGKDNHKIMIPIGGIVSLEGAVPGNPGSTFGGKINSSWNKEHTTLNLIISGGHKKLVIDEALEGMMLKQDIKLEEGKLKVDFTAYHSKEKTVGNCSFVKQ